jgi:hypothetical protein
LQNDYGMDPATGDVAPLARLTALDDAQRETAHILRTTLGHYVLGGQAGDDELRTAAAKWCLRETDAEGDARQTSKVRSLLAVPLERIVREQAFTILNRLCAIRMAEAREVVIESVGQGYRSRGFPAYQQVAGAALGETGDAYRHYLFSLFDELAVELPVLFDRFSPLGRLFPRPAALLDLLELINHVDLRDLWAEDETLGWIYQYFNSQEERRQMRAESQAPRNSRELAVRNQFFTPRYVVEFLTDNTLGRIWYEMMRGKTALVDRCRYLVRRPKEIFLGHPALSHDEAADWVRAALAGDFASLPERPRMEEIGEFALLVDGYEVAPQFGYGDVLDFASEHMRRYLEDDIPFPQDALELWLILFAYQRGYLRNGWRQSEEEDPYLRAIRTIYECLRAALQHPPADLSQEELLQQPVFIPHRRPKDPRTILMLDPGCGSMHFGLYSFDLYEIIYEEAWRKGLVDGAAFGLRDKPVLFHESVRLRPVRAVYSNYSNTRIAFDDARVVVARTHDAGDGVEAGLPYLLGANQRLRVPLDFEQKLSEFDYQSALAASAFTREQGERFIYATDCWTYEELPVLSQEAAQRRFLRDMPRLIIEHNIHGIDIDPRAVQIAGLSLWLRAQRSWQRQGVKPAERPTIRKSNVVCAEPMPGDRAQLDAFLKTLRDERLESLIRRVLDVPAHQRVRATPTMADALCDLVRVVWDEMKLAGEAGSLLKIEESLATAIQRARDEWERQPLFRVETFRMTEAGEREARPKVNYTRDVPGAAADFWAWAETLVLAALAQYAEQADGDSYARRLFAADAARGFAFIDVCRKRYDVALMNPPFGQSPAGVQRILAGYPTGGSANLYAAFIVRTTQLLCSSGGLGVISDSTFLKQPTFLPLRRFLLSREAPLSLLVDLGWDVLDANVRTAMSVVLRPADAYFGALDVSNVSDPSDTLLLAAKTYGFAPAVYDAILALPKSVYAIGLSVAASRKLAEMPALGSLGSLPWGCGANDSFRLFRVRWEIAPKEIHVSWALLTNGGSFSPFYRENYLLCRSRMENGESAFTMECRNGTDTLYDASARELYYAYGLTYPKRSKLFHVAILPRGHVFTPEGKGLFLADREEIWSYTGLLNSTFISSMADLVCGPHKQRGDVELIKIPELSQPDRESIAKEAVFVFDLGHKLMQGDECSTRFASPGYPSIVLSATSSLRNLLEMREIFISTLRNDALDAMMRIDGIVAQSIPFELVQFSEHPELTEERKRLWADLTIGCDEVLSYLVGAVTGRWNITCSVTIPAVIGALDRFAAPSACPPGMLQNAAGLPATPVDVPADYPLRISWPGILVDDPGHPEDIVGRVREAMAVIWDGSTQYVEGRGQKTVDGGQYAEGSGSAEPGVALPTANRVLPTADAIEQEACQLLGVASLRDYFGNANRFFDDHLKRYSKSRRQAPIYWPLSTASGAYTLWIYYHRLTDQVLYTCVVDFVDPKLKEVSEDVARLRQSSSRSRDDERDLARLSDLELELKEVRAELLRLAPIWKPNLNDGVQITAAPLWKLFQHRNWQRTLRETWAKLEAGDYDWAHLALSFWPARVVPKCTADRSLAIAHDVENPFWVEEDGRWRPLAAPEKEIAGQLARQEQRLSEKQRGQLLAALRQLATGPARGVAASQVAQHLAEGAWDDTELALLCWPGRVAEKCLDDADLANTLRLNLPAKRTQRAIKRWTAELSDAGCPGEADAVLATLEADDAFDRLLADLEAGRRDAAPLALALWPARVIDRCLERVELAAAHDLGKYFWVEDDHGWRRRREPNVEVQIEIGRRQ